MSTTKLAYAGSTTITCTLASLASSATAGRGCAAVDNSSNLYDDALLTIAVKTTSSPSGDKACYVWVFGSEDGTAYSGSTGEAEGTDAAVTIDQPSNLRGPFVINCPAGGVTYKAVFAIAQFFGGVLPKKWGFVLQNATGNALDSTEGNHQKTYSGITYTTA